MRIAPTKHVSEHASLLGVAARVLAETASPCTVSELWHRVRERRDPGTFARFTLALDLLFLMGAVELDRGLNRRVDA
jgi:hypothetical protein